MEATMNVNMRTTDRVDYKSKFTEEYIIKHTRIPINPERTPKIVGWSSPARSGSTALLYLFASHPQIDRAYFQPQKTLMRNGGSDFVLREEDKIVGMKEVFRGQGSGKVGGEYDPIDLLIRAGVPKNKITWIFMLRDPVRAYSSLRSREPYLQPSVFTYAQRWLLYLYEKYRDSEVRVVPYVYELAKDDESKVVKILFEKVGLESEFIDLKFDKEAINQKLVPGQLADKRYFEKNIKAIFDRKRYLYSNASYDCPRELIEEIEASCRAEYEKFYLHTQKQLGL